MSEAIEFKHCDAATVFEEVRKAAVTREARSLWDKLQSEITRNGVDGAVSTSGNCCARRKPRNANRAATPAAAVAIMSKTSSADMAGRYPMEMAYCERMRNKRQCRLCVTRYFLVNKSSSTYTDKKRVVSLSVLMEAVFRLTVIEDLRRVAEAHLRSTSLLDITGKQAKILSGGRRPPGVWQLL